MPSIPLRTIVASSISLASLALPLGLSLGSAGCSSDATASASSAGASSGGAGSAGSPSNAGANASSSDQVVGGFLVELKPMVDGSPAYTSVSGEVFDGPNPSNLIWTSVTASGGCELLKPSAPFCDPGCGGSAVCVSGGKCQSYATAQDLGPVILKGLGDDLTMKAVAFIYGGEVDTPYPAAAEGAALDVAVTGGLYGAFHITTSMVSPLVTSLTTLQLESGKALALTWTAPGSSASSKLRVKVDISHHGGIKGKIECEVADNGSLEIPEALVTQLIALGVAGFPTVTLTRVTSARTTITPAVITFEALSSVVLPLTVAGFTSCSDDTECPTGKTCQQSKVCTK